MQIDFLVWQGDQARFEPRRLRSITFNQPFNASLNALAGWKDTFLLAAILIGALVAGLRPSRSGASFTLNLPKAASVLE